MTTKLCKFCHFNLSQKCNQSFLLKGLFHKQLPLKTIDINLQVNAINYLLNSVQRIIYTLFLILTIYPTVHAINHILQMSTRMREIKGDTISKQ